MILIHVIFVKYIHILKQLCIPIFAKHDEENINEKFDRFIFVSLIFT